MSKSTLFFVCFSLVLHALLAVMGFVSSSDKPEQRAATAPMVAQIEFTPVTPPPEPSEEPQKPTPLPPAQTRFEPLAQPKPQAKPTEAPPAPPVVGVSQASVTPADTGVAYQQGDTLMGASEKISKTPPPENTQTPTSPVPSGGVYQPVVKPVPKRKPKPVYPEDLLEMGVETDVVVLISINAQGFVKDVKLVQKAQEDAFNQAALKAAWQTEFSPAMQNGQPVPYSLRFTFQFRIEN